MKEVKIISILKSLSESELKDFERFIASPYFNRSNNVRRLFDIIKKYYPEFKADDIEEKKIYRILYPNKKFDYGNIKKIISDLGNLGEDFLSIETFRKDSFSYNISLLEALNHKKLDKYFTKKFEKMWSYYQKIENYDLDYFYRLKQLEIERSKYFYRRLSEKKSLKDYSLQGDYFVLKFIIDIFQIKIATIVGINTNIKGNFDVELVDKILEDLNLEYIMKYIKKNFPEYYKIVEILYYLYIFQKEDKFNKYYPFLLDSIKRNLHLFSRHTQNTIFAIFIAGIASRSYNYCHPDIEKDIFEIQKIIIENKSYVSFCKEEMDIYFYRNTALIALRANEIGWAEKFINDYKAKLDKTQRESVFDLMNAFLSLYRKNFEGILNYLTKVKYNLLPFKLDVKLLTLIAYYELGLYDYAYNLIRAFDKFLEENPQIFQTLKISYKNFLNFYKKLLKIKSSFIEETDLDIEVVKNKLLNTKYVYDRKWLQEKASELLKRYS